MQDYSPVLGNDSLVSYPEWTEVKPETKADVWFKIKRDFPHVNYNWLSQEYGVVGLGQITLQQLQQIYKTLVARKLDGLML